MLAEEKKFQKIVRGLVPRGRAREERSLQRRVAFLRKTKLAPPCWNTKSPKEKSAFRLLNVPCRGDLSRPALSQELSFGKEEGDTEERRFEITRTLSRLGGGSLLSGKKQGASSRRNKIALNKKEIYLSVKEGDSGCGKRNRSTC